MQKKQIILIIVSLIVITLSVTYAFFKIQIIGDAKNITVNSKDLKIVFTGGDSITGSNLEEFDYTKTFTIENKSDNTYKYNIVVKDLVNTFKTDGFLLYKITSDNKGYSMNDFDDVPKSETEFDTVLAYNVSIDAGVKQTYTIEFKYTNSTDIDQSADMEAILSGKVFIDEGTEEPVTLLSQILKDNPTRSTRSNDNNGTNDFATPLTATTTGTLFTSTESITGITGSPKEVYYYAGNTTKNWVKFGGFYWRIIRTNHDGSIRLLYVGTSTDTSDGNIGKSNFNPKNNSPKYSGYMYGEDTSLDTIRNNTTDSTIKTFVDTWYKNNLTNYTKYLSTSAVYCNDRSEGTGQVYDYASNPSLRFNFASYYRMDSNTDGAVANPSYNCSDIRDAFSVDNTSAKLEYPIALMTVDEMAFAGGVTYQAMSTPYAWFVSNSVGTQVSGYWWSLSPFAWVGGSNVGIWGWTTGYRYMSAPTPNYSYNVRPVISLKSCVQWTSGDGTVSNPYIILETESGC